MDLSAYDPEEKQFYDELFAGRGQVRQEFEALLTGLNDIGADGVLRRQAAAEAALLRAGITFTLRADGDDTDTERIFPFDIIPRIISSKEWEHIETGIVQRLTALNLFLSDVYGDQKVVKDGIVPEYLIKSGTDLVRDKSGEYFVLEDNVRCPSGVSYVLENRQILKRTFPLIFDRMSIR